MEEKPATGHAHGHSVGDEPVTSVLTAQEVPVLADGYSADEEVLAALGYKLVSPSLRLSVANHEWEHTLTP
jgi:hypothetical protein